MPTDEDLPLPRQQALDYRATHQDKHNAEKQRQDESRDAHAELHQIHQQLHDAHVAAHEQRHASEERAILAATSSMDKRLDEMNEFRNQLRDQAATFVRQETFDTFRDERRHALAALEDNQDKRVEELRTLIYHEREERRATEGARRGINQSTAVIVGTIATVGAILGIVVVLINLLTGQP